MSTITNAAFLAAASLFIAIIYRRKSIAIKSAAPPLSRRVNAIAVYCGASTPLGEKGQKILAAARKLGEEMAKRKITLVYGGGNVGLMGEIARAVDTAGGNILGYIPRALCTREIIAGMPQPHNNVYVSTMHERKALMAKNSDAFIAMPGGCGTMDEMFEMATWTQLGIQTKSVGILNIEGYYDNLLAFMRSSVEAGLMKSHHISGIFPVRSDPVDLLDCLEDHLAPAGYLTPAEWDRSVVY